MPRREHFHVLVAAGEPPHDGRIRYAGRTKRDAEEIATVERKHWQRPGKAREVTLERCEPPCDYDADNPRYLAPKAKGNK